jgi:pimeloyl-ACP methyl ester carboxylesterase
MSPANEGAFRDHHAIAGELVRVGDFRLSIRRRGAGRNTVLLHGGGPGCTSAADFSAVVDRIETGRRLWLIDLAQYGESDAPNIDGPVLEFHATALARLIADYIPGPVDLVCQSLGGSVALLLAAQRPELVRRIVVTASQPILGSGPDSNPGLGGLARAQYYGGAGPTIDKMRGLLGAFEWFDASAIPEHLVRHRYSSSIIPRAIELGSGSTGRGQPQDLTGRLRSVRSDVLLIWGAHDPFSTPTYARRLADSLPSAELAVIPSASHHPQSERPAEYASLATEFLDRPIVPDLIATARRESPR